MKPTVEQIELAHNYMRMNWVYGAPDWSDLKVMEEEGDTEMLANALVDAGAINSKTCYPYCKEIEETIEALAKRYKKLPKTIRQIRVDEVFQRCFVSKCNDCNGVQFLNDGNENLYPEVKTNCWECNSKNIETYYWEEK